MQNKDKKQIWIIEDDKSLGTLLLEEIQDAGYTGRWQSSAEEALRTLEKHCPELIISDLKLPGMNGLAFLGEVLDKQWDIPPGFLIITAFGTISKAVEALKAGADDFLTKPLDLDHFILTVKRILEKKHLRELVHRMQGLASSRHFHGMYGNSNSMRFLFERIQQVAKAHGPVLIIGESGTGKELVANAIHKESLRAGGPFLPINCAGVPENLMESEFFGHAEGSFTGARKSRQGLFAEAEGGSLLLDEISEMPLHLQAKLLRILQGGSLRRLGENRERNVDVRIMAATHRDLEEAVRQGHFREDLFFRLEAFTIHVPPLREREDDIELLAHKFKQQYEIALNKNIKGFSDETMATIKRYPFPGNVRELKNAIERAVTFTSENQIREKHLPSRIRNYRSRPRPEEIDMDAFTVNTDDFPSLAEIEQRYIRHILKKTDGNKRQAASILGIGRRTLYRKIGEKSPSG